MELTYARWLSACTRFALGVLVVSFLAYVSGLLEPRIPLDELPRVWTLPLDRYLEATGAPAGWAWLRLAGAGDYANLIGIGMLGAVTLVCYLRLLPQLLQRGERALALVVAAQVAVLLLAASGLLAGGGH